MCQLPTTSIRDLLDHNPMHGEPRLKARGSRHFWNTREIAVLREHYPKVGVPGCLSLLPGRSASSIYQRAHIEKLDAPVTEARIQKGVSRQHWANSPGIDAVIRDRIPKCTQKRDLIKLAESLGRPRWWVSKRAAVLGLIAPRFREPRWSDEEINLIREQAHHAPNTLRLALKRAGFTRTTTAIVLKLKRTGSTREDPDHFTAQGLSELMGIDRKTVGTWCERGQLAARRRGTERTPQQGGDQWWIHRRDVRRFIIENAAVVDIRKVDKFWFIDLLANGHRD